MSLLRKSINSKALDDESLTEIIKMKKLLLLSLIIILLGFIFLAYKAASPFLFSSRIKIDLPQKENTVQSKTEQLIIYIKQDTYTLTYKSVESSHKDLSLLLKEQQEVASLKPSQRIVLNATKEINYSRVIHTLNLLKEAGWDNVQLIANSSE